MYCPLTSFFALLGLHLLSMVTSPVAALPSAENSVSKVRTIARFPNPTALENIAVRSNGKILVTLLDRPEIYQVDPVAGQAPVLVHRFDAPIKGLTGIAEIEPDVFAVIAGQSTVNTTPIATPVLKPGTNSIWTVDLRLHLYGPVVKHIASVPSAQFLNGLTYFERGSLLLAADSAQGAVYSIDPKTGVSKIVMKLPSMLPLKDAPAPLGINGLRVDACQQKLFFQNSFGYKFAFVELNADGTNVGPAQIISNTFGDDFALDNKGRAYVATNMLNSLDEIDIATGKHSVIAGKPDSRLLPGCAAVALNRWPASELALEAYLACTGGIYSPIGGNYTTGGSVIAVRLS